MRGVERVGRVPPRPTLLENFRFRQELPKNSCFQGGRHRAARQLNVRVYEQDQVTAALELYIHKLDE